MDILSNLQSLKNIFNDYGIIFVMALNNFFLLNIGHGHFPNKKRERKKKNDVFCLSPKENNL